MSHRMVACSIQRPSTGVSSCRARSGPHSPWRKSVSSDGSLTLWPTPLGAPLLRRLLSVTRSRHEPPNGRLLDPAPFDRCVVVSRPERAPLSLAQECVVRWLPHPLAHTLGRSAPQASLIRDSITP